MADTNPWVLDLSTNPPNIYNGTISEHKQNAFQAPYPSVFWYVNQSGNDVINDTQCNYHTPSFTSPYPYVFWQVNDTDDDVIHDGELDYYHYTLNIPYPYVFWFTNQFGDDVTHYAYYNHEPLGACRQCRNLTDITIPKSVKKIGPEMATNTLLSEVTIADDCEYSSNSFPQNCTVNFYPAD
jgi:hypothetical protein